MEGVGPKAALGTTVMVLCAIAVSGCGEAANVDPVKAIVTDDPAATFAPLVRLHPDETAFPIDVRRFVERSSLKWSGSACVGRANVATGRIAKRKTPGRVPHLKLARLGGEPRPYVFKSLDANCRPRRQYRSTEVTRPYDPHPRPPGLPRGEGFYLDLLSDSLDGDPPLHHSEGKPVLGDVPAYYQLSRHQRRGRVAMRIRYWLLFASERAVDAKGVEVVSHEGDWQQVEVLLGQRGDRRWRPLSIALVGDNSVQRLPWSHLERTGSHPVLYSARERHELYAETGRVAHRVRVGGRVGTTFDETATCGDCLSWPTWRQLRPLREEPWYGFGGGWGLSYEADVSSGPLGPIPAG